MEVTNFSESQDGIDPRNRAMEPLAETRIRQDILSRLSDIRGEKQGLVNEWSVCFDVWDQKHRVRLYEGASDLYIPVARNIVETFVAQIKGGVFPTTHRMWVEASGTNMFSALTPPSPQAVGELLRHFVEQSQMEKDIEAFIRDALIYGTAIVKTPWVTREAEVYRRRPMLGPAESMLLGIQSPVGIMKERVRIYNGPAFRRVDPMRFFVHPITSPSIDEAQMVFEDVDVSYSHLLEMEKRGIYFDVKRVLEQAKKPDDNSSPDRNTRLTRYAVNVDNAQAKQQGASSYGELFTITELWCYYDLDGTGTEHPCKIVVCGDVVLEARCNPFFDQRPPYRSWKLIEFPDLFFGQGLLTGLKHMNYAVNALINQGIDAAVFQSNPLIFANGQGLTQGMGSIKIGHRSIVYTNGKPSDNIELAKIPDTSPTAFTTASLIMQAMRDMAGAPPILQGKLGANEQTATEAQILGSNAQSGVDNFIRSLEASVLSPLLRDWYLRSVQFLDDMVWLKVAGEPKPVGLTADDLVGDYKFRWLVSTQMRDEVGAMQEGMIAEQTKMMSEGGGMAPPGETPAEMGGQPLAK